MCPDCRRRSKTVHSYYERTAVDLHWGDRPVRLRLKVRRFRCRNPRCSRRIFDERLPHLAPRYARRTPAQQSALEGFGFTAGGSAGARLANRRGIIGIRATVLRFIHASPLATVEAPRVLRVDDWSLKRGRTSGTILVDLEHHRVVAPWRITPGRPGPPARPSRTISDPTPPPARLSRARSPRQARWLLVRPDDTLTIEERAYRDALLAECPDAELARRVAEEFGRLVRERDHAALSPWLLLAASSGLPEMREFACGIIRDTSAVEAALSYEWSSGQTEGQVNRLKFLRRQM